MPQDLASASSRCGDLKGSHSMRRKWSPIAISITGTLGSRFTQRSYRNFRYTQGTTSHFELESRSGSCLGKELVG
jgi:hypothetical protein